ncbi:MAG: hypothetical protein IH987_17075 [Planctomycetes bacterium]|nr:hypothetical protein [Planctomycetota bacterium]
MENEKNKTQRCTECQQNLDLGVDAVCLTIGVIGPRGFVTLDEKKFFCNEDCLRGHVGAVDRKQLNRRIP